MPKTLQATEVARLRLTVQRLSRRLRRQSATGLTPSRLSALSALERNGPLAVGQLAAREQIAKSSVTRLVARLEADELIAREPDQTDGRSWQVALTDKGRALLEVASERADAYLEQQLRELTAAERARLYDALPILERLLDLRIET